MPATIHRIAGRYSLACGLQRMPFGQKSTNHYRDVTCPKCRERTEALRASAKARAGVA